MSILPFQELIQVVQERRSRASLRVVHCHGVFDLLHVGHIKHFQAARKLGDLLVVTLTPDRFVNKGPQRPIFPQMLRAEAIAALACVDYVAINEWPTAVETLTQLKPDLYVKGQEYRSAESDLTGKIGEEEAAVRAGGGQLVFTDEPVYSSSQLINAHHSPWSPTVQQYLAELRPRVSLKDVLHYLDGARGLRVLLVGETILDEYQYCEAIGKSSKEPTLVTRLLHSETSAGGILALANHTAAFSDNVSVLTMLGATNSRLDFVEAELNSNVKRHYIMRKDGPTIVKRRLIEEYFFTKLLEIYEINDVELCEEDNQQLCDKLELLLPQHDLVVVVDYGHGFLSRRAIELLCQKSRFLAINAQTNAGNMGYHTLSLYPRANLITTTEKEIRLELRQRGGDLRDLIREVSCKLDCPQILVTRGKHGCLAYDRELGFSEAPAIAGRVVDRIGAGDALLSVAALCSFQKAPLEITALVGNAAGAQAVAIVGNREPISRVALLKQVEALLK